MFTKKRNLQNSFYNACTIIKLSVNWMNNCKFYGVSIILILGLAVLISPIALSYLAKTITINSTGRILATKTLLTQISEIRGVFLDEPTWGDPHNWTLIAETLAQYGINAVFVKDLTTFTRRPDNDIRAAIDAFHAKGIQYHSCIDVLQNCKPSTSLGTEAITPNGTVYSVWSHCPIKAHDYVLAAVRDYLGNFSDVDGIILDFIRYAETQEVCYCDHCRAAFDAWYYENYGQHVSNWTLFYPNQQYVDIYNEWQTIPITQLVKDIHDLIKSINPYIVISECAWSIFDETPIYWRLYLGQDTACWIKEGYIDLVAPMMYTKDPDDLNNSLIHATVEYWMGGSAEGPVKLVPILRNGWSDGDLTPEQFEAQIDIVRSRGLDGWIIWRYAGPGCPLSSPDIRDYLEIIDMPQTFTIGNINVETTTNSATITWLTTLPTTSKVEYSKNQLYSASWEVKWNFHYWNIVYAPGIIVEDNSNITEHKIILTNLTSSTTYYYRVQSKSQSSIVTSSILAFKTKS